MSLQESTLCHCQGVNWWICGALLKSRFNDYPYQHLIPDPGACAISWNFHGMISLRTTVEIPTSIFLLFSIVFLAFHVKHIYLNFNDVCNDGAKYFPHYIITYGTSRLTLPNHWVKYWLLPLRSLVWKRCISLIADIYLFIVFNSWHWDFILLDLRIYLTNRNYKKVWIYNT